MEGDHLQLRYAGGEPASLAHWHRDTFQTQWQNRLHAEDHAAFASFEISELGVADRFRIQLMGDDIDGKRAS